MCLYIYFFLCVCVCLYAWVFVFTPFLDEGQIHLRIWIAIKMKMFADDCFEFYLLLNGLLHKIRDFSLFSCSYFLVLIFLFLFFFFFCNIFWYAFTDFGNTCKYFQLWQYGFVKLKLISVVDFFFFFGKKILLLP